MSYLTVEVELENGRVRARAGARLPAKADEPLTILKSDERWAKRSGPSGDAGRGRFVSTPGFAPSPEQCGASLESGSFDP